ncbi:MAG: hypothetical protein ACT6QU_11430 [Aliihoeflea sp.]|uniref:hypothetical protein n=1 Tax=Aliihoeflea sp. TaxID=2608088 RepID=UPI004034DC19
MAGHLISKLSAAAAALAVALSACAAPQADPGVSASTASVGSGVYPNLNVPLQPATAQITPAERAATADELRARRDSQAATDSAPASSAAQLRRIGSSHAQGAISRIERN